MHAAALVLALVAIPVPQEPGATSRPSLEELLDAARARRDAARRALAPQVAEWVARLDRLPPDAGEEDLAPLRAGLAALPPDAAPLLAPYLDPGPDAPFGHTRRAEEVARALAVVGTGSILSELGAIARSGSARGKRRAVELLAASPGARAQALLEELWRDERGELAEPLLVALFALVPPERAGELAAEGLSDPDGARLDATLAALRATGVRAPAAVGRVLARPGLAGGRLPELVDYYAGAPEELGRAEAVLLLDQVARESVRPETAAEVIERLPDLDLGAKTPWREDLERFAETARGPRHTAALVALARMGSRAARRELLARPSARISDTPGNADARMARGDLYLRLHEPEEAARDYRRAFELVRLPLERRRPIGIALARALCRTGDLREAAGVLGAIRLSPYDRRELALDPDFALLAAHPRHGEVLAE